MNNPIPVIIALSVCLFLSLIANFGLTKIAIYVSKGLAQIAASKGIIEKGSIPELAKELMNSSVE